MSSSARDKFYETFSQGIKEGDITLRMLKAKAERYGLLYAGNKETPPEGYVLVKIKDHGDLPDGAYFIKKEMVELIRSKTRDEKDDDDFFYENEEITCW